MKTFYSLKNEESRYCFSGHNIFLGVLLFCSSVMIVGLMPYMTNAQYVGNTNNNEKKTTAIVQSKADENRYKVEVKAFDYAFKAPQKIPSGWVSFVLNNKEAKKTHELSIGQLPKGVSYKDYLNEYIAAWEKVLKEFQNGEVKASNISKRAGQLLPVWSEKVKYVTSRGLISPGRSAQKTVYLEPGKYTLDCWVKTSDGLIHISRGMSRPITVTNESTESGEPNPDSGIILHKNRIEVDWQPGTGDHTFALSFMKNENGGPVHSNLHLIKINDETDLGQVNNWLDWYRVGGLRTPAPAEFLGGVSTYYADPGKGATYFSVNIDQPGTYAWIVHANDQQLWKTFTIKK